VVNGPVLRSRYSIPINAPADGIVVTCIHRVDIVHLLHKAHADVVLQVITHTPQVMAHGNSMSS